MLPTPYEILELPDHGVLSTRISSYEIGEMTITPRDGRPTKVIPTLRITVPTTDKTHFPFYWDITAQTLIAQLVPFLLKPGYQSKRFTITKQGVAPKARFTLGVA
jgi:hypothetical protein